VVVAEEKTRVLTAQEERRFQLPRPALVDGKIVFYCGNGHRVVVQPSAAGKEGTCSKCKVSVRIPTLDSLEEPAAGPVHVAAPPAQRIVGGDAPSAEGQGPEPASGKRAIVAAPPPVPVAPLPPGGPEGPTAEQEPEPDAEAVTGWESLGDFGAAEGAGDQVLGNNEGWAGDEGVTADGANPTAVLLERLWSEQQHGGIVQVHLRDGGLILPQEYAPRWSQGTHALFASSEADGTITLTAVAWDAIQKIVVRNLKDGLPPGMFD